MRITRILVMLTCGAFVGMASETHASFISGGPGLSSPDVTITFSEVPLAADTAVTNQFSAFGIQFSGFYFDSTTFFTTPRPTGAKPDIKNMPGTDTSVFNTNLSINFTQDVTDFATSWASAAGTFTMSSYQNGNLVESFNVNVSNTTDWKKYGFANSLFDEIQVFAPGALLIDDLQFNTVSAVPEPTSMALLGLASLGGIGLRLRRNRKARAAA